MEIDIFEEVLIWSDSQPAWQGDALRRLFAKGSIEASDLDDLTDLCKAAHGLSPAREAQVLGKEHLAITGAVGPPGHRRHSDDC